MGDGHKSTGLDPAGAGRLLRAVSVEPPLPKPPAAGAPTGAPQDPATVGSSASMTTGPANPGDPSHPPIPGYIIDRLLGEGGGGTVYRAFRQGSDRPLALKILKTRAGDPAAKRAWRELEILEHLRLPCLPRLIDYGEFDGHLFFAAEFIEGQHLDDYCNTPAAPSPFATSPAPATVSRPADLTPSSTSSLRHSVTPSLPLRPRVELLARVADAVQSLHEHGVIHRDLKPSNIIVADDGQPMLVDLGLAASADAVGNKWTVTQDGAPAGTPAFMAPEQARGERSQVSTRTDVYGLGATALFVLTGHTPHASDSPLYELIHQIATTDSRHPRALDPSLPKPLAAVLSKALSREPKQRYASAGQFADDLRRWGEGRAVEAGQPSTWARTSRWVARHPVATTGLLCLTVAVCALAGTYVSVNTLWNSPAGIMDNAAASEVQLLSYAKRPIHSWPYDAGQQTEPPFAKLVPRAPEFGGGQVVLTKIRTQNPDDPFHYQLCLWDLSDLSAPKWATARRDPTLVSPPPWHDPEESYNVTTELLADVFPGADSPGLEIVVVHQHAAYHAACIRVYDFAGSVLFEAWHKGSTGPAYWIPDPGVLVFRACCGYASYEALGVSGVPEERKWPDVVFAVRPRRAQKLGWICPPIEGAETEAAWYYMMHPVERAPLFRFSAFRMPDDSDRRADCVDIGAQLVGRNATLALRIDAEGRIVGTPVVAGALKDEFPNDPEHAIWLGPVPVPRPSSVE